MVQEDKELLLKDLAGRLPYGLYATVRDPEEKDDFQPFEILGIKEDLVWVRNTMIGVDHFDTIEIVKPYLRPMDSMTEEERKKYRIECKKVLLMRYRVNSHYPVTDWLNAHHFDYRGLIEKGLAIEVTKDNNPYKD